MGAEPVPWFVHCSLHHWTPAMSYPPRCKAMRTTGSSHFTRITPFHLGSECCARDQLPLAILRRVIPRLQAPKIQGDWFVRMNRARQPTTSDLVEQDTKFVVFDW